MISDDNDSHSEFEMSDGQSSDEVLTTSGDEDEGEDEERRPGHRASGRRVQRQYGVPLVAESVSEPILEPVVEVAVAADVVEDAQMDPVDVEEEESALQPPARVKKKKVAKIDFFSLHPDLQNVWDLTDSDIPSLPLAPQPPRMTVQLLPFQLQGLQWMLDREETANGGILADEMGIFYTLFLGMGKTIQMISMILSDLDDTKLNLVVCPAVALMQWYKELQTRTAVEVKVLVHHGPNRCTKADGFEGYNVVLTTYAILEQGYRKEHYGTKEKGALVKRKSIMHKIHWHRFILDEAHAIKDRYSNTARACFAMNADKKWCKCWFIITTISIYD